jgi:thiol-disulfide isomerase/thioredoxin
MIGILIAVIVVVGVAVAADLLLSFAVIRRLAALQARVKSGVSSGGSPAIGHRIGDFRIDLITGGVFTPADLTDSRVLVAFFMTGCEPCKKTVAELGQLPAPLPFPLYVLINGRHEDADVLSLAAAMPPEARVGRIAALEETVEAFGIDGYPTVLAIEDGAVTASGLNFGSVLEPASAR